MHLIPYRESDQIVILFTADVGLLKIMCYGSRSHKSKWRGLCRTLTLVEVVFQEKNGEIFTCKDLTLLNSFEQLKHNFLQIEAACDLLNALNRSQLPGKEAHKLYALLIYYLKKVPEISDPWVLSLSFRLKLLRHDGLLDYPFICHSCEEKLFKEAYCSQGESYCAKHTGNHLFYLDESELQLIYLLTACQSYHEMTKIELPVHFKAKILDFFEDCLKGR